MDRMFVVTSVQYRPEDSDAPPKCVDEIGFSLVRLMQLSGGEATGVRANLKVTDASALDDLAHHYTENTRLEWTFEIGGGGGSFSVVLRWTKFDRLSGNLQIVRTAVLRDLVREAEGTGDPSAECSGSAPDESAPSPQPPTKNEKESSPPAAGTGAGQSDRSSFGEDISSLWPRLFGRNGTLDASASEGR